ncbi:AbrB/MazE/SpoVT family DNA-binding domain-containing protein [Halorubrum rubrum]|uniref:AbrB/MazE/SpoVT family DNA-binding domain-containing protein n=1 Tax=Halorubrum rubrum TaxID=1126240 RepID=A0ABD5QXH0_9EURY|nr:phosphate uptake regulator PhoU [Halorubrum rubrum]
METRKLQRVGGGTYTVSIPKRWAVQHDLDASSEVHLYAHADGSIVVRSSERDGAALDRIELGVDGDDSALVRRLLRSAYGTGYETVTLRPRESFADETRRAARRTKRGLVGAELVADAADELTLRNLLATGDVSVRQTVVQLQFVACSALRQAAVAFDEDRAADLDRLRERADEADRLFEMIARHFNRSLVSMAEIDRLGVRRPTLFDYYAAAGELAAIAESSVTIGRVADGFSGAIGERLAADVEAAADAAEELVASAAAAVLEGADPTDANEVLADRDDVTAALDRIERAVFDDPDAPFEGTAADARALTRLLDALARTVDHAGAVAAVAMRAAVREGPD